jgi:hypothetical protein
MGLHLVLAIFFLAWHLIKLLSRKSHGTGLQGRRAFD